MRLVQKVDRQGMRLVQKVGRRSAENFNLTGLHRLDIKDYLFTSFFLSGVITVVDYFFVFV